ncbi:putative tubulin gamma chain [Phaeomoniella chlamydospora]|uniref:Putative tubulin gamma chain n=1 Tax=Phaeomoniella chlamydospora TaxID=158046 RepID=A0A0G2GP03_PHACM|nr:putative tubulin gamma chain [Phaeomoniella chlamydospora]
MSDIPAKTTVDNPTESKQEKIDRVQGNLELPEQPPVASDWNSANAGTVNVGSGGQASDISKGDAASSGLREPQSTANPDLSNVGRQGVEGTKGPPPGI